MTREEVKKMLPIIEAFAEGKQIEIKTKVKDADWSTLEIDAIPYIDFNKCDLRIKPEPKYRPFKDAEECWNEMQKHQPFGWTKVISKPSFYSITKVEVNGCIFSSAPTCTFSFKALYSNNTFADGTPFGMKDE